MLQECAVYTDGTRGCVVYTTLRPSDQATEGVDAHMLARPRERRDFPDGPASVPYYHPAVRAVAFHFAPAPAGDPTTAEAAVSLQSPPSAPAAVRVDFAPFGFAPRGAPPARALHAARLGASTRIEPEGRLGRTALSLLRLLHNHSFGHATHYVKRVLHDVIVPRDEYQDVYIALRDRYAGDLIAGWREVTDPKKHVFEDLGIAAWIMVLWKYQFADGRAPGGFVDIGCGNGLLVYILTREGFHGYGCDARERRSWAAYRDGGADLRTECVDAAAAVRASLGHAPTGLPDGCFLIGNHADELTPWIPVLASSIPACAGFVNIPCCPWTLQGDKFTPTHMPLDRAHLARLLQGASAEPEFLGNGRPSKDAAVPLVPASRPLPPPLSRPAARDLLARTLWFVDRQLHASDGASHSKHLAYYAYVTVLHMQAGWCLENEALRIPSTKNWAFVGRHRVDACSVGSAWASAVQAQWQQLAVRASKCRPSLPVEGHRSTG
ncbi:tRNA(Ser) (uridine(44)-2'-O)-methyltransferase [Malassezia sp. CBS 17886]|nr:tRNA(Ser) (uridine(44)-2'-O)-methyltransferase [Malassezia sp. CBS 17886]